MAAEFVTQPPLLPVKVEPTETSPSGQEQKDTPISDAPPTLISEELKTRSCENDQPLEELQQPNHVVDVGNSVSQLCNLSDALSDFRRCYDELQQHIHSIKSSIDAQLAQTRNSEPPPLYPPAIAASNGTQTQKLQKPTISNLGHTAEIEPISQPLAIVSSDGTQLQNTKKTPSAYPAPALSQIEIICKSLHGRNLRKYVVTHFSETPRLRVELPAALKLARYPGRLVLSSCGKLFRQGIKKFTLDNPMMKEVQAMVLILESFLLMGGDGDENKLAAAVKKEAQSAAREWLKRLRDEGGVDKAVEIEARGLLLFIGCFGLACSFKKKDVTRLIQKANAMEISGALRNSAFLVAKIPAMIEWMIERNKELEAVNIVAVFGLENQYPPQTMLTSFLKKSNETWAKSRVAAHGRIAEVNNANKKKLADLKSVLKCLEDHKLDTVKVITEWGIKENISSLEKDIAVSDKTLEKEEELKFKRKADEEADVSNKLKQTRVAADGDVTTQTSNGDGMTAHVTSNEPQLPTTTGYAYGSGSRDGHMNGNARQQLPLTSYAVENSSGAGMTRTNTVNGGGFPLHMNSFPPFSSAAFHASLPFPQYGVGFDAGSLASSPLTSFPGLLNSSSSMGASGRKSSDIYQFADAVL